MLGKALRMRFWRNEDDRENAKIVVRDLLLQLHLHQFPLYQRTSRGRPLLRHKIEGQRIMQGLHIILNRQMIDHAVGDDVVETAGVLHQIDDKIETVDESEVERVERGSRKVGVGRSHRLRGIDR